MTRDRQTQISERVVRDIYKLSLDRVQAVAAWGGAINAVLFFGFDLPTYQAGTWETMPVYKLVFYWRVAAFGLSSMFVALAWWAKSEGAPRWLREGLGAGFIVVLVGLGTWFGGLQQLTYHDLSIYAALLFVSAAVIHVPGNWRWVLYLLSVGALAAVIVPMAREDEVLYGLLVNVGAVAALAFVLERATFELLIRERTLLRSLEEERERAGRLIQELRGMRGQLVHAEKMASMGRLSLGVAHHVRNPLNFVLNFTEVSRELLEEVDQTLAETPELEEARGLVGEADESMQAVERHAMRLDRIATSLQEYPEMARASEGNVRVSALVDAAVALAVEGVPPEWLRVDIRDEEAEVQGRVDALERALAHVVQNAIEAAGKARPAPDVRVEVVVEAPWVAVGVHDNGPGVREEDRERVFEPFFSTKPPGQGIGLGLFVAHEVVVRGHGGRVLLEKRKKGGCTATITLPLASSLMPSEDA